MEVRQFIPALIFLVFNVWLTAGKRKSAPAATIGSPKNIDECVRCKALSDSFTYWMEKTSRGKFDGGDAAWEEKKLKSYARSEVRLVEIEEGLCSEVKKYQDDCYILAEEAEQPLEKWWFKEDPNSVDLYSWLCIETLQHCCPKLHYGESCSPCPLDKDNNICNGHGKCDGEGTRRGNGTCVCQKGYTGRYCDTCDKNFFNTNSVCMACHNACEGCNGSGAHACLACKSGWNLEAGECKDINECLQSASCGLKQYCVNREGSHICKTCEKSCGSCSGPGSNNCTACEDGRQLWSGMCVDDKLKSDFIAKAIQRLYLYIGLMVITIFVFRQSIFLASIVVIITATYVYYSESISEISTFRIIQYYALYNITL